MMKMLKLLGLMVFVVCIAAFASGCGGGGGGGSAMMEEEMPPVMECPQGQVGTYPACMDPPPTDEQRIAEARQLLADILTDARNLAQTASSAAAAVQFHPDATAEQVASALDYAVAAQSALAAVEATSSAGNAAATLAQAQTAVVDAQAALANLAAAQSAVASIQSAVEMVASQRQQMQADEAALTNNSSLIQHVRANKLLSDALLEDLADAATGGNNRLLVGQVGDGSAGANGKAEFFADTGTGANRVVNVRTVQVQDITSDSKTPLLTGTGPLPHGFDLINDAETTFVNAYTDIAKTRTLTGDNPATQGVDETETATGGYELPDTDYLVAGIWLTVNADLSTSQIQAFAYGGQPITTTNVSASCTAADLRGSTTTRAVCTEATNNFHMISRFVEDGKDVTATYRGNANGAYIAGGDTGYFTGSVELTAEFQNPKSDAPDATEPGADGEGSIQGTITNIVAGGQPMVGSIELQKQDLGATDNRDQIHPIIVGDAVGVVDGKSFSGGWRGQFFGQRVTKSTVTNAVDEAPITSERTTTYKPQAPGSVAGTFQVIQKSNPANEAAFIGAFGAHR